MGTFSRTFGRVNSYNKKRAQQGFVWRTTDSTGDMELEIAGNSVKYIDPTNAAAARNGSIENPYNNWSEVPDKNTPNRTYLFKRGTEHITSRFSTLNVQNVSFGAYGVGDRPKLISNESGSNSHHINFGFFGNDAMRADNVSYIVGLDISSQSGIATSGIRLDTGYIVKDCYIHDFYYGIRSTGNTIGTAGAIENVYMDNVVIDNIQEDGYFIQNVNGVTILRSKVTRVNKLWFTDPSDTAAPGDGIQINACGKLTIEDCEVDRSDTGNKFCVINTQFYNGAGAFIKINRNKFIVPKTTAYGGAGLYLADTPTGVTIQFENNEIKDIDPAKGITGVWYHGTGSLASKLNKYISLSEGLGNHAGNPQPVITSENDTFTDCTVNVAGNVVIL